MNIVQAMASLDWPQAYPKSCLLDTKIYGIDLSSHNNGRCNTISNGSASCAIITT